MNYRVIGYVTSLLLFFEGFFMLVPVITAAVYGEKEISIFICFAAFCILFGLSCSKLLKPKNMTMFAREGYLIVSFGWILLSLFGALPFYFSGCIPSFIDALFESVSGFTTTGASILNAVEDLPKCILMWRSFTHWVGGMGVLVFIMAFVPISGAQNIYIMKAESPGPSVSKLVPRVKTTSLLLYSIYFVMTFIEFLLLVFGDMTVFEALNTAFATAGTGGFGFRNTGMCEFSHYSQTVITVFMLLFAVNFTSYFLILQRKFKDAFNTEIRVFLGIVVVATLILTCNARPFFDSYGESLHHSAFTVASLISSTGFATTDFNLWPEISRTIILMLMFVGACAGSTGGGIKVSRFVILAKNMAKEFELLVHPKQVKKIKIDGHQVEHEVIRSVNAYMVCFVMLFALSMFILAFDNYDLVTNFSAVTTTLNNIGPGLNEVGPMSNFSVFSAPSKAILIFDMLAGRLEIFPMLMIFSPATWKK